ncbi:MAG: NAD-dependent DNA ligase LigA [Clostridia bacterium]|nr:NAD-dependent DNA ligase LigA [Clostridia bacterium]
MEDKQLKEMQELVNILNKHCYNYYVLDNPTISDAEYDALYDKLLKMEKELNIVLEDSPSIRVGGEVLSGFKKHKHKERLYSLDKVNTKEGLFKWVRDIKEHYDEARFSVEYKFDGLNLCLVYNNGKLQTAVTRGDGFEGEDVTAQVKTVRSVPLKVPYKKEFIVQGEGIMYQSDLDKFNETSNEPLKNVRNAVAGAIRNLDPKETAKRKIQIYFYAIPYIEEKGLINTQYDVEEFLHNNGFKNLRASYLSTFEQIENKIDEIDEIKHSLDFVIDGAVIKVDDYKIRNELGETIKHPRWAMAYKFEAEEKSTNLNGIEWQVGKFGKITPIAILEPVELAGALISRATLNNMNDIERKQVQCPCRVFVRRSNEVIPEILSLAELTNDSKPIEAPKNCPCCGEKLVIKGANIFCINEECPDQIKGKIVNSVSKKGLNIEGVSEKTIDIFYEQLNIRHFKDLYYLKKEDLQDLEGFRDKKIDNFFESLENSKELDFSNFIYALNIANVGVKVSKDLANTYGTMERLHKATYEELINIYDIGETLAQGVYDYFQNEDNIKLINEVLSLGFKFKDIEDKRTDHLFTGKKVVLTGSLEKYTRQEATNILEKLGAQVLSAVSKKCDYVLCGENAGSKLEKAEKLGIEILTEEEFDKLIEE